MLHGFANWPGRTTGLANDFDGAILRIKHLDAAVAELTHVLTPLVVDANVVRITQSRPAAHPPFRARGEMFRRAKKSGCDDCRNPPRKYGRDASMQTPSARLNSPWAQPGTPQAARHCPPSRRKLLHAIHERVFADDHVVLCIDGDGARQCKFALRSFLSDPIARTSFPSGVK